ncbi:MAG: hypothetical protein ACKVPX_12395 [Myxococcaceae bacterium]
MIKITVRLARLLDGIDDALPCGFDWRHANNGGAVDLAKQVAGEAGAAAMRGVEVLVRDGLPGSATAKAAIVVGAVACLPVVVPAAIAAMATKAVGVGVPLYILGGSAGVAYAIALTEDAVAALANQLGFPLGRASANDVINALDELRQGRTDPARRQYEKVKEYLEREGWVRAVDFRTDS